MTKRLLNGKKKEKVKIFLVFLFFSFFAWFLNQLSETYTSKTTFALNYTNLPDSLLMTKAFNTHINVEIKANGFQLLLQNFKTKKVKINLQSIQKGSIDYYVPSTQYTNQIEKQVPNAMTLIHIDKDTLRFLCHRVYRKQIRIRPEINLELRQNHILEDSLKIRPAYITIIGPKQEIDTIAFLDTKTIALTDLSANFNETVDLSVPEGLKYTHLSSNKVQVSGTVYKFSEKVVKVPVSAIHLPKNFKMRMFPNTVNVVCKGRVNRLKKLKPSDFKLVVDYEAIQAQTKRILPLLLVEKPEDIYSAHLEIERIEYILKQE